ncbi:MAG: vanadium-dependent haloperoxidase [Beijerinckiaceae bacterium]|nr:vanadium-dependent haloperoxidase [Beijerinckiaceae bacterium]
MRLPSAIALISLCLLVQPCQADVVTDWNKRVIDVTADLQWPTMRRQRLLAIMSAAMFDAANATSPRYSPYIFKERAEAGASEIAAASQAAFTVVATLAPETRDALGATHKAIVDAVPDGTAKTAGLSVGSAAAAAILKAREDDHVNYSTEFEFKSPAAGQYERTGDGPWIGPHADEMRPFVMATSADAEIPPPPPLNGAQFLRDLAEVRLRGRAGAGTAEETAIARFHAPPGMMVWNEIGRQTLMSRKLDVIDGARTMALLNFALSDAICAGFHSKYKYQFWRPVTVIRAGSAGFGHPEIAADPNWSPKIATPLHPEYPCLHCVVGSAALTILSTLYPEPNAFEIKAGPDTRRFRDVHHFALEEAESRIYAGVHFRWSVVAGDALGQDVARTVLTRLAPRS